MLRLIEHNLAIHKLSHMRDRTCLPNRFRRLMRQASLILCSEMTRDLDLIEKPFITSNGVKTTGFVRDQSDIVIMPILRGGLTMGEAFSELLTMARIGHIGIYRTNDNQHKCYMLSIPKNSKKSKFIILDPVISQGETIILALEQLQNAGIRGPNIRIGCLVASSPGIEFIYGDKNRELTEGVDIFAIAEDPELDENHYVLPGIGNVSERVFRTDETSHEGE